MSWKMTLQELAQGTGGRVVSEKAGEFTGVGTDTRVSLKGQVFVALKGENFDAHDFLPKAVEQGAAALLVHRLPANAEGLKGRVTIVQVDDTLKGLQALGRFWRRKHKARILGVTGTNGKTTTKEFTAQILGAKFNVQYSKGSFNNHWGVPISLLSIAPEHQIAVIEMGMNHAGEIKELVGIAEPDVVACTMVGRGHLEGLGSIEGVAKAKQEIYLHAPEGALQIFNLDNPWTRQMFEEAVRARPQAKRLTFGSETATVGGRGVAPDVRLRVTSADAEGLTVVGAIGGVAGEARVPVFGAHNVCNLMVASAFALSAGLTPAEIWTALPSCHSGWGRNQWVKLPSGARVLFDAYNANPESMRAAVENFSRLTGTGRKIGVFGEMRELGGAAAEEHRELGRLVGRCGLDQICFIGPSAAEFAAGVNDSGFKKSLVVSNAYKENLATEMVPVLDKDDIVLIKGSRGMQLERVLLEWKPLDFAKK